ncbi:hypothetical protein STEG23_034804, partial [Scotinomys teguina]
NWPQDHNSSPKCNSSKEKLCLFSSGLRRVQPGLQPKKTISISFHFPGHTVLKDVFNQSSKRIAVTGDMPSSSISHQQNDKARIKHH